VVELDSLRSLALEQIKDSLNNKNILTEVSLKFPSIYEEVKDVEYEYLKANWASSRFCENLTGLTFLTQQHNVCKQRAVMEAFFQPLGNEYGDGLRDFVIWLVGSSAMPVE
jgi:hypothetical protein